MRHICLYIGVQIFIARAGAGPPEVVQEALADLKYCGKGARLSCGRLYFEKVYTFSGSGGKRILETPLSAVPGTPTAATHKSLLNTRVLCDN